MDILSMLVILENAAVKKTRRKQSSAHMPPVGYLLDEVALEILEGPSSDCGSNSTDDEACTLSLSKNLVPKLTGRKRNVSEAKWNPHGSFAGMAEVVKVKGKLLHTTGIVRQGRVLLHVEEIGYLLQREALNVFNGESVMTIMDLYTLIMTGDYGCTWDAFKVYLELKTLGYVVARHNIPWSTSSTASNRSEKLIRRPNDELSSHLEMLHNRDKKCSQDGISCTEAGAESPSEHMKHVSCCDTDAKESTSCGVHLHSNKLAYQCQESEDGPGSAQDLELVFDVFAPNSKFKKSDPGVPDFSLCISSNHPPKRAITEALKAQNEGIPVTVAAMDCGRVNFFQFNEAQIACMP